MYSYSIPLGHFATQPAQRLVDPRPVKGTRLDLRHLLFELGGAILDALIQHLVEVSGRSVPANDTGCQDAQAQKNTGDGGPKKPLAIVLGDKDRYRRRLRGSVEIAVQTNDFEGVLAGFKIGVMPVITQLIITLISFALTKTR